MSNYSLLFRDFRHPWCKLSSRGLTLHPKFLFVLSLFKTLLLTLDFCVCRYIMTYYVVLGEVPVKRKLDFVEFESSELVMNLRHVIYDKKKNTFFKQNIDESDLVLWKVDISFGNENDNLKMLDDTSCIINVKQDLEGKEMFSGDPISDHLEHFDKTRCSIHIIVLPPPPPPR